MATPSNYAAALGQLAKNSAQNFGKGLAGAVKGAAMSEMPGITGAYALSKSLSSRANAIASSSAGATSASGSASSGGNVISLEAVRQLKIVNAHLAIQTKISGAQLKLDADKAQFEEEAQAEKIQRDNKLLEAINRLQSKNNGVAANDATGGGFLSDTLSNIVGSVIGNTIGPLLASSIKGLAGRLMGAVLPLLTGMLGVLFSPTGLIVAAISGIIYGLSTRRDPAAAEAARKKSIERQKNIQGGGVGLKADLTADQAKAILENGSARDIEALGGRARLVSIANGNANAGGGGAGATRGAVNPPTGNTSGPSPAAEKENSLTWRVPLTTKYRVTSEFGEQRTNYKHSGIDLAVPVGAQVVAATTGTVHEVSKSPRAGNFIIIKHANGYATYYCHLNYAIVAKGQSVNIGDVIGFSGNTGRSTGAHLHFEIRRNGTSIDPRSLIQFGDKKAQDTKVSREVTGDNVKSSDMVPKGTAGVPPSVTAAVKVGQTFNPNYDEWGNLDGAIAAATARQNSGSGSVITAGTKKGAVPVYDANANKQLGLIKRGLQQQNAATVIGAGKAMRSIWKSDQQILKETNQRFIKDFRGATTRAITTALKQTLFPKGVGVSQAAASNQLFRGQQLGKIFGIDKKVNSLFDSLLGKQYGRMFAPVFSNMAKGYLEVGARAAGRAIFGGLGGMDAAGSNILTGQILGNYAAGKKSLAFEQLLYGTTGVATGFETVFAKYGFKDPMQGIQFMADSVGSAISDPLNRYMGEPNQGPSKYWDPRTRRYVTNDTLMGPQVDAYGRPIVGGEVSTSGRDTPSAPSVTPVGQGQQGLAIYDPNWEAQSAYNEQSRRELDAYNQQQAARDKYASDQRDQTNALLARGTAGSGSNAGGALGGGGFFGNTGIGQVGNMALDLGRVALTQKAIQAMGIKNPYMQILASAALNKGISFVGGKAFDAFMGTETGAALGNWWGSVAPSWLGGSTAAASTAATTASTGAAADAFLLANGAEAAAATTAGSAAASSAATSTAAAGFMEAAAVAAPYIAVAIIAYAIFDSIFGGDDYEPKPKLERTIYVKGNNNPDAIGTTYAYDETYIPGGWVKFANEFARVAFNASKALSVASGKEAPFDWITIGITQNDVYLAYGTGKALSERSTSEIVDNYGPLAEINTGKVASRIVDKIKAAFDAAYAAEAQKIADAAKTLQSTSYNAIANGLLPSLKKDPTYNSGLEKGIYADSATESARIERLIYQYKSHGTSPTDNEGNPTNQVWSMKDNAFVNRAILGYDESTGSEGELIRRPIYDQNVLMYDSDGKPIYDLNKNGIVDIGDFTTSAGDLTSVTSAGTSINAGNLVTASTSTGGGTTKAASVVSNSGNVVDNSVKTVTTINQMQNPHGDLLRSASAQTGV